MPEIHRSALVPYSPAQMFELVRDVRCYPEFLDWVRSARVHSEDEHEQLASLEVALGGLRRNFTTRNRLVPHSELVMTLDQGPFDRLAGRWRFEPRGEGAEVSLDLAFSMPASWLLRPFEHRFSHMADRMVDDFCRRAERIHG